MLLLILITQALDLNFDCFGGVRVSASRCPAVPGSRSAELCPDTPAKLFSLYYFALNCLICVTAEVCGREGAKRSVLSSRWRMYTPLVFFRMKKYTGLRTDTAMKDN
jgi:hypothetical protein